ncbi:uncharacterized protein LOC127810254 [Diospyros lotus]|uniref:uncharacterized protein LOC127810254 n=1 Tax=Diospyros lotus TaxID=55363 RepID=UPI0022593997|nr:uncharacterized protein LOC127810254 [Diospyros lotus]
MLPAVKKKKFFLSCPPPLLLLLLLLLVLLFQYPSLTVSLCRNFCGNMAVKYPFGIDDGCGAAQFRGMLNCSTDLFFQTPSGNYKVQSIDYKKQTLSLYDPTMSTCSILQPRRDFALSAAQSALLPVSPDTVFALLNCSLDSPVLNHYRYLCLNFSGHSCDELYGGCSSFRLFHIQSNATAPPCCFTSYATVRYMSLNILDCTHYTSVYGVDSLKGVAPLDWLYGVKLSYAVADTGCDLCARSGGTCGFDVDSEATLCICSPTLNSTRQCGLGNITATAERRGVSPSVLQILFVVVLAVTLRRLFS